MPKTLNIAVIGAGTMAQAVHLPVLRRRWDRFAVSALVEHSPRRRRESAEVWGIDEEKRYENVDDLVAAIRAKTVTVDAALLSTDGIHVDDVLALMRRGIPVLVEPPLGYSAEEIAKVADFERMTGRRLMMLAHPQQYDDAVALMGDEVALKDLRMIDHEVLMPASQPLYGRAHVTSSAYDLPSEKRTARRTALQDAVRAGSGEGANQRDRDLYVKGLLTGVAHQLAVIERAYGPVVELKAVRHWPKGVIPGSIELWGELEGGTRVRLVWHYLPFAPEYVETVKVLSARRRMRLELPAPSHADLRSELTVREKKKGVITETTTVGGTGPAEAMWEAFHAFVIKGTPPAAGAAEALTQVGLLREVLAGIVEADGRTLDPEPEEEPVTDAADPSADDQPTGHDDAESPADGETVETDGEGAEAGGGGDDAEGGGAPGADDSGAPDADGDEEAPAVDDGTEGADAEAAADPEPVSVWPTSLADEPAAQPPAAPDLPDEDLAAPGAPRNEEPVPVDPPREESPGPR